MSRIRIVTDSSAHFLDPALRSAVTVVPLGIQFGNKVYREDIEIDSKSFFQRFAASDLPPRLIAPSVETFTDVYSSLSATTNRILSIHLSRQIHPTWGNARAAASALVGGCEIAVLDSQTTSIGLGLLIERALALIEQTDSLDEVVRTLRKLVARTYAIFCVENLTILQGSGLVSESQAAIGNMLNIRPIVTIEDGELIAMEKVRTMNQAIDHFVEFVTEFNNVEQVIILQQQTNEHTRTLQERLTTEFKARTYPTVTYKPSLGTLLGTNALGIIVFEGEGENDDDDTLTDDLANDS
jgi:DegV family protein with EDD domain